MPIAIKSKPTSPISRLEDAIQDAVRAIRSILQGCEDLRDFELNVEASGRVHDGEIKISYSLGSYYNSQVKGGRLEPVITEFARRHGWAKANQPLCIGYIPEEPEAQGQ